MAFVFNLRELYQQVVGIKSSPASIAGRAHWQTAAIVGDRCDVRCASSLGLGRTSFWYDEAVTWQQVSLPFLEMYQAVVKDTHPPLYNLMAWPWIRLFGDSEFALRLLSAIPGTATVYLLYRTGRLLWSRELGLLAAVILTFSGFHIWYSQEFRPYALLSLTSTLYMFAVFRLISRPSLAAYLYTSIGAVLLLFSHIFGMFLFAGVNLLLISAWLLKAEWLTFDYHKWLVAQIVAIGLFGHWAFILLGHVSKRSVGWIPELDWYQLFSQLAYLFNGPFAAVILCCLALYWVYITFTESVSGRLAGRHWRTDVWKDGLILLWLAFPILIAIAISLLGKPIFMSRYMILCLPAMCLVASRALFALGQRKIIQRGAILLLSAALLLSVWHVHHRERDQYRTIVRQVQRCHQPGDLVAITPGFTIPNFQYYWRDKSIDVIRLRKPSDLQSLFSRWERIWLIRWSSTNSNPMYLIDQAVASHTVIWSHSAHGMQSYLLARNRPGRSPEGTRESTCPPQ